MANTKNTLIESDAAAPWERSKTAPEPVKSSVRVFYVAWYGINILLVLAVLFALYAFSWELSTRRYLKGFSDAIVPASAPTEEKIQSVLAWMAHGPARLPYGPSPNVPDRDPTDTLNYDALLQVCGTATNAFINLMDTGNVPVRRLLLVDERHNAKHVVAEAYTDGRWIIVDPAYRLVLRDSQGRTVTREELTNPETFADVTGKIPRYDPNYTFDRTEHVRLPRIPILGVPLRDILNRVAPTWSDSPFATLLVERESYAAAIASVLLVIFLLLARILLRWFGEHRLHLRLLRARYQLQRSVSAFFNA
ncbi:MAG: hypothetical protein ABSC71_10935 [Candidatus Acidiferrales bacterium]|jgi:hypothetical protein